MEKDQNLKLPKTQKNGKILATLLIVLLIVTLLISVTLVWAKYTQTFNNTAIADAAKWNITANVTNTSTWSKTFTHVTDQAIAPGTSGYIPIDIYMNDTEVCARYTISICEATGNVPTNLRVYRGSYDTTNGYGKLNANDAGSSLIDANTNPVIIAIDTIGVPQATGTVNHATPPTQHHAEYTNTTTGQIEPGHVKEYIYWEWPYETGAVNEVTGIAEGDAQDSLDGENALINPTMTLKINVNTVQINPEGEIPYNITYNLDGGTLATSNPTTYTLETSGFTLNNPTKDGYTFTGWSGTDLTGDDNLTATIAYGSSGDREYTANWKKNIQYTIRYNGNGATGATNAMPDQPMTGNLPADLNTNYFIRTGYQFVEWNTEADGSGQSYANSENVNNLTETENEIVILYAQWRLRPTKYAVQIYGINQDVDANGNTLGLTFGPAVGTNCNTAYITHDYADNGDGTYNVMIVTHTVAVDGTETVSSTNLTDSTGANVTRTAEQKAKYDLNLHEMTWAQIAGITDKTRFKDCMLCGDTKGIEMNLNDTIGTSDICEQYGDGSGLLYLKIKENYRKWNEATSNAKNSGGYASSKIRATLIGSNNKTNTAYAGTDLLDSTTCLFSCIESDLRNLIVPKKIRYVTGSSTSSYNLNEDIADPIWLFSEREVYGSGANCGNTIEGLGTNGEGYSKFGNTESKYYMSSYNLDGSNIREIYHETGGAFVIWLRSPHLNTDASVRYIYFGGDVMYYDFAQLGYGIGFGFCIR